MKEIIEKIKQKRNQILLDKCFELVEELEDYEIDSLKCVCEVELEDRRRRKDNTIECLNVQRPY